MIEQQQRPVERPTPVRPDSDAARPHGEAHSQVDQIDDTPQVETPVEARQGFLGKPVLLVLGVSLALAVLAGILVGVIPV
jgi:hypothetical protein